MNKKPVLWIIIPCYNEQEVLPVTAPMFLEKLLFLTQSGRVSEDSRILFVNDGSKDKTWEIICDLAAKDPHFMGISQSRNRGHQNALVAGMMEAKDRCDITITIDCDGQDDLNAMDEMVDAYLGGTAYGPTGTRTPGSRGPRRRDIIKYSGDWEPMWSIITPITVWSLPGCCGNSQILRK